MQRNYGFVISTLDEREYILSAVTHGIRNNWINALKSASNLNSMPESDAPKGQRRDAFESEIKISRRNTSDTISISVSSLTGEGTSPRIRTESGPLVSPPLNRTPTSRLKKEKARTGRTASLKSSLSMGSISLTKTELEARKLLRDDEFNSMIPERDVSDPKHKDGVELRDSPILVGSLSQTLESTKTEFFLNDAANQSNGETDTETQSSNNTLLLEPNLVLARQTSEITNLRKKLDNMNADMDTTLKNLNNEQVKNFELEKKIQDVEQENSLLQIKTANAEKSLREQSKEITSLNQKVREFSDLSSQYKTQVAENKTLRQRLEKIERINTGPNWKSLYESLQSQHQKERVLWENKLKEMENELQNLLETSSEAEQKGHIITDLSHQLQDSETRINQLLVQNDSLERENRTFKQGYEDEINRLKENVKELEEYIDKTDKSQEESNKDSEILRLRKELSEKGLVEAQVEELEDKLTRSRAEIEGLKAKLLEASDSFEAGKGWSRSLCSSRENLVDKKLRMVRMDSLTELMSPLSDPAQVSGMEQDKLLLCYNDVVCRFNKAIAEIKALKVSVKQAQSATDGMEIKNIQLNQALSTSEKLHADEVRMMSNKIEDLTSKYLASEKQVRSLKLKVKGSEGKERRRSSTNIRPDELLVHREAESVLDDIETSLINMEGYVKGREVVRDNKKKSYETSTKASRARRRSSENSELSFVERLKKTEKAITDMSKKMSVHGESSSAYLDLLRKQLLAMISRTREETRAVGSGEVEELLGTLEAVISSSELPALTCSEPGFPKAESIASHLDTVMSFLYRSVEEVYEKRRECSLPVLTGSKVCSLYDIGTGLCSSAELARLVESQQMTLQAYLLMDLQQQVSSIQTRFFAYNRQQTLKDYGDVTKSLLLKVLESKQFVPLSSYACKKLKALSSVSLNTDTLAPMFRRLKREAQALFSRIGTVTAELMEVFAEAVAGQVSDKDLILDGIRSEVYNLVEEDERMREFQTSLVSIYLICSDCEAGKDPERINLMANRDEALQSQTEVTRILIDQELAEFAAALDLKVAGAEGETEFSSLKEQSFMDTLSQAIFRIAAMVSQKCVTEAQITILNTILSLEEKDEVDSEDGELDTVDDFVFGPENPEAECNEFMLVLNNYRQTQTRPAANKHKLSLTGQSGNTLESNLKTIRRENENKKARLSAALSERRAETPAEQKYTDLRVWCEKSMTAMEKSYENLLQELQVQHHKEKDNLKREKEQALAEETRATLSALDAMRKAHESEVQKEVEKFKKEFLQELRSKECIGALQSEYQEDRDEIRREILSVTAGEVWAEEEGRGPRLTRSPSCPRLYSNLSVSSPKEDRPAEEPLKSPLTGMVANRKRVFETEY